MFTLIVVKLFLHKFKFEVIKSYDNLLIESIALILSLKLF